VTWLNRERFDDAVKWLALPDATDLVAAGAKSDYQLAKLRKLLSEPPRWDSTRPARPAPQARTNKPVVDKAPTKPAKK
jgi:hypothetical protein